MGMLGGAMAQPPEAALKREPQSFGLLLLAVVVVGVAARIAMGFESFWLDEAWSWSMARQAESAAEIFTSFKHDNNHPLNTLYLYAVSDSLGSAHWFWLRLPSLLAGAAALVLLARLGRAWGRVESLVVVTLAATSFPMISASAQARGYALAIAASLAYVALTRADGEKPGRAGRVAGLTTIALAGLLSHPTFVYPLAGAAGLTGMRVLDSGAGARRAVGRVLVLHGIPVAVALLLFALFYADGSIGGGPLYDRWVTVRQAAAQTMGLPRRGPLTWIAALVAVVLSVQGMRAVWQRGQRDWACFFVVALAVAPAAVVAVSDPKLIYARYLLTTFPWFYLLAAVGLGSLWRGAAGRLAVVAVVGFFALSNGAHTARVLAEGRDDYLETVRFIDRLTEGERIVIGSDHDFRNGTVLRFYAKRVASGRPVVYVPRDRWPARGPEWYLRHDWKAGHDPDATHEPLPGLRYERVESFEHGAGDGFQWFVYRRIP